MADKGSRSYGGKRNHGLGWVPWVALLLLALIALAAFLIIRNTGDSGDASGIDTTNEASATAGDGDGGVDAPGGNTGSGISSSPSTANAQASAALVGGGGVKVSPASGDTNKVQGTVLFSEDSAALDAPARQVITSAATLLRSMNATDVTVTGYTDVVGGTPVNSTLSQDRATAVADELRRALGSAVEINVLAKGEADPVAPNQNADGTDNPDNRQQNRRAVIAVSP